MAKSGEGKKVAVAVPGKQFDLPFYLYQRYRLIADVLESLREGSGPVRILDVSRESVLSGFLSEDEVTIPERSENGSTARDAMDYATPFGSDTFDYVVSVDSYGDVEPGAREGYLTELRRVARKGVLVATPFDSAMARDVTRILNDLRRAMRPAEDPIIPEPEELPGMEHVRDFFEQRGDSVSVLPNGYVPHRLAMGCLTSYESAPGIESADSIFRRVNAFYNEVLYELDNTEPSYGHLVISLRNPPGVDLYALASARQDPERTHRSVALLGAISAALPLASEVKRLNTRLAQRESLLARKEAQVNDLSRRIAEQIGAKNTRQVQVERRLVQERNQLQHQIDSIQSSRTWRVFTTLRLFRMRFTNAIKSLFRSG